MSIARCLTALVAAAAIGGCASAGAGGHQVARDKAPSAAAEELALLRLAEKVEAAALAAPGADIAW